MQHNDRSLMIGEVFGLILEQFSKKEITKILNEPFEIDNNRILWIMTLFEVQRRTAKEWLQIAQQMVKVESDIREEIQ